MAEYVVSWTVDTDAETPQQAAQLVAIKYFQNRIAAGDPYTACVFNVVDKHSVSVLVDLAELHGNQTED
jgi:hypothetical protein